MQYGRRSTKRNTRKSRARAPPKRKTASRRRPPRSSASRKPVNMAVYSPARPLRQVGYHPFAPVFQARLHYGHSFGISAPATSTTAASPPRYCLNSLFDPDNTGVGHQPMQYDQLTGIYRKYLVHACKVDLEFSNPSGDALYVGYNVWNNSGGTATQPASSLDLGNLTERRNAKMVPIVNSGNQTRKMSIYVPMATLMGVPRVVYKSDRGQYAAAYNANPAVLAFLEILALDPNGGTTGCTVRMNFTYYAELYEMVPQTQS